MPLFPSVEWFQTVADLVNKDENYRHHGTCDAVVGIQVDDRVFEVTFEAFEVTGVRELAAGAPRDLDFSLVLPLSTWREMLENIKANGQADLTHTLNSIDLSTPDGLAQADDYYRRDLFYRLNQSFQHFFDASVKIDTTFDNRVAVA